MLKMHLQREFDPPPPPPQENGHIGMGDGRMGYLEKLPTKGVKSGQTMPICGVLGPSGAIQQVRIFQSL